MEEPIRFRLNGRATSLPVDAERTLLWLLRTELGLTGAKYGCGAGLCGACTVLVDGEAVRSCTYPAWKIDGRTVTTIEGLAADGRLHPLQQAFVDHDALQCGYCTPGMILTAHSLLARSPRPTRAEIIRHMDANLCRCGSHRRIVLAIEQAAAAGGRS
jgi:aerobic-type carbon monoxide dehydrogenase small subunit (CoxS/CutS family)